MKALKQVGGLLILVSVVVLVYDTMHYKNSLYLMAAVGMVGCFLRTMDTEK